MQNIAEAGAGPIIYGGRTYPDLESVTEITPFGKINKKRCAPPDPDNLLPPIVMRRFPDGKRFLAYKDVTLIPTTEGYFLAQKVAQLASTQHNGRYVAFDIGTGSGIFALYLSEALNDCGSAVVVASDISGAALEVAGINFAINGLKKRPKLRKRDVLDGLSQEFGRPHLIVSNPPFYTTGRYSGNGFEPTIAIDGGPDGMDFYRKLFAQSAEVLDPAGNIIVQVQEKNLHRVLGCIDQFMPGSSAGVFTGPHKKVCGVMVGTSDSVIKYADNIVE